MPPLQCDPTPPPPVQQDATRRQRAAVSRATVPHRSGNAQNMAVALLLPWSAQCPPHFPQTAQYVREPSGPYNGPCPARTTAAQLSVT